ncbi:MAG: outer membrane protein assembly factor BamD [Ignavibacteriales bacterium]|nr:outer membrane protein assembly factor BamD [Ignavibacteriales bacterium]
MIHRLAILFSMSAVLFSCSSEETVLQLSAEQRFALGMKKFQNEDYLEASEDFKNVTLQYQGSRIADSAQFMLAECRFVREEYVLAAYEYDLLIRTLPTSKLVPTARFRKATCYYRLSPAPYRDQEYTKKAIDEYQAFIEYYPTDTLTSRAEARINELNTKLAEKDFENGLIYMRMDYNRAAGFYFDLVLDKYHDTPFAEPALLKKAETLFARKKYSDSQKELARFFEKYPTSSLRSEAEQLRADLSNAVAEAGTSASDSSKAVKSHSSIR